MTNRSSIVEVSVVFGQGQATSAMATGGIASAGFLDERVSTCIIIGSAATSFRVNISTTIASLAGEINGDAHYGIFDL